MLISTRSLSRLAAMVLAVGAMSGCKDFLHVENPGPIEDSKLNAPEAVPAFVTGMSGDLSNALDEIVRISGVASDELGHGGSYAGEQLWVRGIINYEDINAEWSGMQRARWVAEQGIERIKELPNYSYDTDLQAARANMFAGFANRLLGENVCETTIDAGPRQPSAIHFPRAEAYFTEALRIAEGLPLPRVASTVEVISASRAGRASVRAWQGKWTEAVADAAQVPDTFVFRARYSTNSTRENNSLVQETYVRREFTVFGTQWAQVFNDPRVQWDTIYTSTAKTAVQKGQDGQTNFFRQKKYPDLGADIPLVKGAEMRMLRAEAALRNSDIAGSFGFINQQRAIYQLPALPVPATVAEAWPILQKERGAVVWLEARRLWDLRRWNAEAAPVHNAFLDSRAKCIPISKNETLSNPNLGS